MTSKRQPKPKHTVAYQVANLDEAFDRMRSQCSEAHLIYALVNEETRQCYVGYGLGRLTIEAKKRQLEAQTGHKFTSRVLAAEAYANEHEMRTKKLLAHYITLYEQGWKMVNKRVPGTPLDKEAMLISKPELYHLLAYDYAAEGSKRQPRPDDLGAPDVIVGIKNKRPHYVSDDNWF